MNASDFNLWLSSMPKAELHLHIDGSLQAQRMLSLAEKNSVSLPYNSVEEVEAAYSFVDLQSFLDLYYLGASVLKDAEDFYHLMMDYLLKCKQQNIVHCEIMVEPQTYFPNGVSFETMISGFNRAITEAERDWGQSVLLILSFLRHLSEEDAIETLKQAEPFRESFIAIGLASSEVGNPPEKFKNLYAKAREQGYLAVAHAGEEGPPEFIWNSLKQLKVERIDHGVRCMEDKQLIESLKDLAVPLTVCPLSNIRLCVFNSIDRHNILDMLNEGLVVTVNSDDPAYFGGYLNENYIALAEGLNLTKTQAIALANNSFKGSFLSEEKKAHFIANLEQYCSVVSNKHENKHRHP